MPSTLTLNTAPVPEPVEFSVEDAVMNTWIEDTGLYLRLDTNEGMRRRELNRARLTPRPPRPYGSES